MDQAAARKVRQEGCGEAQPMPRGVLQALRHFFATHIAPKVGRSEPGQIDLEEFKRSQEGGLDLIGKRMLKRGKRIRP
jgi:hypothetical protein